MDWHPQPQILFLPRDILVDSDCILQLVLTASLVPRLLAGGLMHMYTSSDRQNETKKK